MQELCQNGIRECMGSSRNVSDNRRTGKHSARASRSFFCHMLDNMSPGGSSFHAYYR